MKKFKGFTSTYDGIGKLLESHKNKREIALTFKEIEKKIGKLPPSAKKFHTWWANNRTPKAPCRHSRVWLSRGFITTKVDLKKGEVYFIRAKNKKHKISRAEAILKAGRKLFDENIKRFTRKEIAIAISHLFPKTNFKITSIDAAIQAMTEKSNSSKLVGKCWRDTLKHLKRGYFALNEKGLKTKKEKIKIILNKSDRENIKEKLEKEFQTKFYKKNIKINKNLKIPLDLLSEDKNIAVKFYNLGRKININTPFITKVHQNLYLLNKTDVKNPIIILKKSKLKKEEKKKFLRELKPFFKDLNVYLYEKKNIKGTGNLIKLY